MKTETLESIGAAGNKLTIGGAAVAGGGWLTASEIAALVGALVAIAGLLVTWYYKREANRRHALEHELRMERLRRGLDGTTDLGQLGADE